MMRFRFSSGLTLGLTLGIPVGALLALLLMPSPPEATGPSPLRVEELTRKLDQAREARERADHQLEQFQKLAEQMTTSFQTLEARFKALEARAKLDGQPDAERDSDGNLPPSTPQPHDSSAAPPRTPEDGATGSSQP
ncbi:MAG: YtxH domain-containing protein [Deltaproteobacteria bacterium]|nr:YtxH domain-containing protein [Deltaproteobacteria bacterium]